jgi:hypothetical protein
VFEDLREAPPVAALCAVDVEATPAGPALAVLLAGLDLESLDEATLVEVVAAWQRQVALGEVGAALAAAELARRESMNPQWQGFVPADPCVAADELAMRLGWSKRAARRLVEDGRALDGELSAVADAVVDGTVDGPRMRALLDALRDEPYQVAWPVLAAVLPRAATRSVRQLRDDVERAVLAVCPDETQRRHEQAFARRRVDHPRRLPRGMAGIWAVVSAEDAAWFDGMLEATARAARAAGDPRTLDQLRADTFVGRMIGGSLVGGEAAAEGATNAPVLRMVVDGTTTAEGAVPVDAPDTAGSAVTIVPRGTERSGAVTGDAWDGPDETASGNLVGITSGGLVKTTSGGPDETASGDRVETALGDPDEIAGPGPFDDLDRADASERCAAAGATSRRAPPAPRVRVPRIQVNVTVALSTLLGLDEDPVTLDGYGPISAVQARALAHGGVWRRLVTDPLSGAVLDVGRKRYRPPADLADHVRARDGRCAEPGCATPAERCDLDHTEEFFADGAQGETSADNLGPLCHRANLLKTGGGFTLTQPEPGRFVWTTPAGLVYEVRPGLDGEWRRRGALRPDGRPARWN